MAKIIKIFSIFLLFLTAPAAQAEPISISLGISMAATYALCASAALSVVSAAVGITSAVVQGKQQKAIANYQNQVNQQNAKASREAAQAKIENQRRAAKFTYGTQLARLGGMGALAEGSPLDIMGQTAGQYEYDNMVTEYEGEVQAIQFQQQAALNKYEAQVAEYNIGLNVANHAIKGMSGVANSILGATGGLSSGSVTGTTPQATGYSGTLPTLGK